MKIKCINNTGLAFKGYNMPLGHFETSEFCLTIGEEYTVMGIVLAEGLITYLIDDKGRVTLYPFQLFEVTDNRISNKWFFKKYTKDDELYPFAEAVWGYYELVFDDSHYEELVDLNEDAYQIYFKRKLEIEDYNSQ
jgi:hypothetical protein